MKRSLGLLLAPPLTALALFAGACSSNGDSSSSNTTVVESKTTTTSDTASVKLIQADLDKVGCWAGTVDGEDGPATEAALKEFQKEKGLEQDGEAGEATMQALETAASGGTTVCVATPASTSTSTTATGSGDCGEITKAMIDAALPDSTVTDYVCAIDANGRVWVGGNIDVGSLKIAANFILMQGADTPLVRASDADMAKCSNPPIPSALLTFCESS